MDFNQFGGKGLGWTDPNSSSFYQLLVSQGLVPLQAAVTPERQGEGSLSIPHGTTVLALTYADGVVMAGDRMATEGHTVSERRIQKVYQVDKFSSVAFAGAAGPCMELTRLFQVELEHYEKLEGTGLSTQGKANKLAQMIRGNFPLAMQGLVVVPIFAGYDTERGTGCIFKYDVVGGKYEETDFHSVGSGSRDAKGSLKKIFRKGLSEEAAIAVAVESLYDASEGDTATGSPDMMRGIFPTIKIVNARGVADVPDHQIKTILETLLQNIRI